MDTTQIRNKWDCRESSALSERRHFCGAVAIRVGYSENELIRILLERQVQILADCRAEIQKHEFQADYDKRNIQKLNGVVGSQRDEINRALQGDEQF